MEIDDPWMTGGGGGGGSGGRGKGEFNAQLPTHVRIQSVHE